MEMIVYSVYDKKTKVYGKPIYAHTDGHVLRMIMDEMDNKDSHLSKYAEDFSLNTIAKYDDSTGVITPQPPSVLIELLSIKDKEN